MTASTEIVTLTENGVAPAPATFDPTKSPIRLLADQADYWQAFRSRKLDGEMGITWDAMRAIVDASRVADGTRADRGLGALDHVVVDYDQRGVLHVTEATVVGGRPAPTFAPVPMRAHAFRQLAARASAPASYLAKLPAGLARACMMHGLANSGDTAKTGLLRMADGEARAIVTGRYAVVDHDRFLDAAETAFGRIGISLGDLRISALATGPRLVVRVTMPARSYLVDAEDRVELGVDLTNGELGNAAGRCDAMLYRLLCTNGLRISYGQDRRVVRHIGDPERVVETLTEAIPASIENATGTVETIKAATQRVVERATEVFGGGLRLFGLTAAEERAAGAQLAADRGAPDLAAALTSGPVSVWDVTNAITASVRETATERRIEVESAAGDYLRRATR